MQEAGINRGHVPYQGRLEAPNDSMGGLIVVVVELFAVAMHRIKAPTIKRLAVKGRYREPTLPDLPTFKQGGLPGAELSGWLGICGPPQLREDIRQSSRRCSGDPGAVGFDPAGQDTNTVAAYHGSEVACWKKFTSEIGMSK